MTHPRAGHLPQTSDLLDVSSLVAAYYSQEPDLEVPEQRVSFGTSGHRGIAWQSSFTEAHVLALTQAVCDWRKQAGIDGPLFLGKDTHALSGPAFTTCLEVLAGNGVQARIQGFEQFTPTPAVSVAVLDWNYQRAKGLADGIVLTPSHNPPEYGGFKYNPSHGGPAGAEITSKIQNLANAHLAENNRRVTRLDLGGAKAKGLLVEFDFMDHYVNGLAQVIDFAAIAAAGMKIGVNPLGGASLAYWPAIAERYNLRLELLESGLDPAFSFVPLDHDGTIRMDCSSSWVMQSSLERIADYDLLLACDPDADRHGVLTRAGLMPSNSYLCAAAHYLFSQRSHWSQAAGLGKTVVSTSLLDRIGQSLQRPVLETPVGFKWFVNGLNQGGLAFACEESAGGSFLRFDGRPWSTDKDGPAMCLVAAELMATTGRSPTEYYADLTAQLGCPLNKRADFSLDTAKRACLSKLPQAAAKLKHLAGEPILAVRDTANGQPFGGIKVESANSWFAIRPSGTEPICKVYLETYLGEAELEQAQQSAFALLRAVLD